MPGGRPPKATSLLKLQGTFRKERHNNRADEVLVDVDRITEIECPTTLKDEYVISYWKHHTNFLLSLGLLKESDIPELEIMYHTLEKARELQVKLKELDIIKDIDDYDKISKLYLKFSTHFSKLASQYYISPVARTKLTMDHLNIEKLKKENSSIMEKMAQRKRA